MLLCVCFGLLQGCSSRRQPGWQQAAERAGLYSSSSSWARWQQTRHHRSHRRQRAHHTTAAVTMRRRACLSSLAQFVAGLLQHGGVKCVSAAEYEASADSCWRQIVGLLVVSAAAKGDCCAFVVFPLSPLAAGCCPLVTEHCKKLLSTTQSAIGTRSLPGHTTCDSAPFTSKTAKSNTTQSTNRLQLHINKLSSFNSCQPMRLHQPTQLLQCCCSPMPTRPPSSQITSLCLQARPQALPANNSFLC